MAQTVIIYCKNTGQSKEIPMGSTLRQVYNAFQLSLPYQVLNARVNNRTESLRYQVYKNKDVEFLDISHPSGYRAYVRSLSFVLCKAVEDLYPNGRIFLEHPISQGYFVNIRLSEGLHMQDIMKIKSRMREIVEQDISFERLQLHTEEAIEMFRQLGRKDKANLLSTSGQLYTYIHRLGESVDFYYGSLVPSTGYIDNFDLVKYYDGALLRVPCRKDPDKLADVIKQKKMYDVFTEELQWNHIMHLYNVSDINHAIKRGWASQLIQVAEALQEKKIAQIADTIAQRNIESEGVRVVLIAGPSSSGKTTFSKRLGVQLMCNALRPVSIEMDNYFVEREKTPRDENGEYNYESVYAIDIKLFNSHLRSLLAGEEVSLPTYNFKTGHKEYKGNTLKLSHDNLLIIEGIHALNPEITPLIPDNEKFKIYVSALTTISLDDHNWIPTTDNRLLRRIIRDHKYRGYSAQETIARWDSVRNGEDKWIFPHQENADVMFNSALVFELSVIRRHVEPILLEVPKNCDEYAEAYRLLRFMSYFVSIMDNELPPTSLLREFLGGSSFNY